jgi:hypothetical protein
MKTVVVSLVALLLAGSAAAQTPLRFEAQKVTAKIQKPEIQIYITKQNLTPRYALDLKESFLPKVVESVEARPF